MESKQNWITEAQYVVDTMAILNHEKKSFIKLVEKIHDSIYSDVNSELVNHVREELPLWKYMSFGVNYLIHILYQRIDLFNKLVLEWS